MAKKPASIPDYDMKRALEIGYKADATGHWPSVDNTTGIFLKSPNHPSVNLELDWFNGNTPEAVKYRAGNKLITRSDGRYQYVPKGSEGTIMPNYMMPGSYSPVGGGAVRNTNPDLQNLQKALLYQNPGDDGALQAMDEAARRKPLPKAAPPFVYTPRPGPTSGVVPTWPGAGYGERYSQSGREAPINSRLMNVLGNEYYATPVNDALMGYNLLAQGFDMTKPEGYEGASQYSKNAANQQMHKYHPDIMTDRGGVQGVARFITRDTPAEAAGRRSAIADYNRLSDERHYNTTMGYTPPPDPNMIAFSNALGLASTHPRESQAWINKLLKGMNIPGLLPEGVLSSAAPKAWEASNGNPQLRDVAKEYLTNNAGSPADSHAIAKAMREQGITLPRSDYGKGWYDGPNSEDNEVRIQKNNLISRINSLLGEKDAASLNEAASLMNQEKGFSPAQPEKLSETREATVKRAASPQDFQSWLMGIPAAERAASPQAAENWRSPAGQSGSEFRSWLMGLPAAVGSSMQEGSAKVREREERWRREEAARTGY